MKTDRIAAILSFGVLVATMATATEAVHVVARNDYLRHRMFRLALLTTADLVRANVFVLLISITLVALSLLIGLAYRRGRTSAGPSRPPLERLGLLSIVAPFGADWALRLASVYDLPTLTTLAATRVRNLTTGAYDLKQFFFVRGILELSVALAMAVALAWAFVWLASRWVRVTKWRLGLLGLISLKALKISAVVAAALLALVCVGAGIDRRSGGEHRLNVVWILIDALRADHLGCYGYARDTSPFLDELAGQGVLFENAFSQESYTLASAASYFTSTYPSTTRVLYVSPTLDTLSFRFLTVAEILREENYATAAFVYNPSLKRRYNFGQGFDLYDDNKEGFDYSKPDYETYETARKIYEKTSRYMAREPKRPLFLYLHYRDVHTPYSPPPPYDAIYLPAGVSPAPDIITKGNLPFNDSTRDIYISQYDGEIRYTDDNIRKMFELLESSGINRSNTIFIICADHGEEFMDFHPGDSGGMGHGRTLYREQIHVPLIFLAPGLQGSRRVKEPVGMIDVAPTVLDLLGIAPTRFPQLKGSSLIAQPGKVPKLREVCTGGSRGRGAVMLDGWKYLRFEALSKNSAKKLNFVRPTSLATAEFVEELYRTTDDPAETRNLIAEEVDQANMLRAVLLESMPGISTVGENESYRLDAEAKEQLRSLGYIE